MENWLYFGNGKTYILYTAKVTILITNRKWHTPFQMKLKSSTLDDLEGH